MCAPFWLFDRDLARLTSLVQILEWEHFHYRGLWSVHITSQGNGLIRKPKVILYYDYFLTLPKEVEGYWHTGSHSWASIMFLANRYVALLGHLPLFYGPFANPCTEKVGLNSSACRCSLIHSSVSTCESLDPDAHPSLGLPLISGPTDYQLVLRIMAYSCWFWPL